MFQLEFCNTNVIDDPDEATIKQVVESLPGGGESHVLLGTTDDELTYVQAIGAPADGFTLEWQDGSLAKHFRSTRENLSTNSVVSALWGFLQQLSTWDQGITWEKVDLEPRQPAGCVQPQEIQPDPVPVELEIDVATATIADRYRQAFARLGKPLTSDDQCDEVELAAAERRLQLTLPPALRAFYLVAGREDEFNQIDDRYYPPEKLWVDGDKIVFLEENQAVVLWSVSTATSDNGQATVYQGVPGEGAIEWYVEHADCATFVLVMIHWHGAFGAAMRYANSASVPAGIREHLDQHWTLVGEVNGMRAYNRLGCALCLLRWDNPTVDAAAESDWRIFAGACTQDLMDEMGEELRVVWED